ncbi:hypothetical protein G647_08945 [Cladophialophora carrionii CBS 160.54]|uniref:Uncharacterized protein n=1 Tax=Cladophialophora carrionii CBS 160.54 TaxID=1279043 RepID=V9CZ83_9EURO|nr:uncharacterized protein G647_08945 [Cladophialophora carrionii CBS 160.54]ETI19930.1 hypothetical protein G647_08945 [Cladophialophora carrionii CBS 160.54]
MFDPIDWFMLMCCWCCDRKDKDEEEYEVSERERARQQLKADLTDGAATPHEQPKKPPQLAHAPPELQ